LVCQNAAVDGDTPPILRALAVMAGVVAFGTWVVTGARDATDRAAYMRQGGARVAAATQSKVTTKQIDSLFALVERERGRDPFAIAPAEPLVRGAFTIDVPSAMHVDSTAPPFGGAGGRAPVPAVEATDPELRDALVREVVPKMDTSPTTHLWWHAVMLEAQPTLMAWHSDGGIVRGFVLDNPAWTAQLAEQAGSDAVITVHLDGSPPLLPAMQPPISLAFEPNPRAIARANDDGRAVWWSFGWQTGLGTLLVGLVAWAAVRRGRLDRLPSPSPSSLAQAGAMVDRVLARVEETPRKAAAANKAAGDDAAHAAKRADRNARRKAKKRR
jgi:hypothetical protein